MVKYSYNIKHLKISPSKYQPFCAWFGISSVLLETKPILKFTNLKLQQLHCHFLTWQLTYHVICRAQIGTLGQRRCWAFKAILYPASCCSLATRNPYQKSPIHGSCWLLYWSRQFLHSHDGECSTACRYFPIKSHDDKTQNTIFGSVLLYICIPNMYFYSLYHVFKQTTICWMWSPSFVFYARCLYVFLISGIASWTEQLF